MKNGLRNYRQTEETEKNENKLSPGGVWRLPSTRRILTSSQSTKCQLLSTVILAPLKQLRDRNPERKIARTTSWGLARELEVDFDLKLTPFSLPLDVDITQKVKKSPILRFLPRLGLHRSIRLILEELSTPSYGPNVVKERCLPSASTPTSSSSPFSHPTPTPPSSLLMSSQPLSPEEEEIARQIAETMAASRRRWKEERSRPPAPLPLQPSLLLLASVNQQRQATLDAEKKKNIFRQTVCGDDKNFSQAKVEDLKRSELPMFHLLRLCHPSPLLTLGVPSASLPSRYAGSKGPSRSLPSRSHCYSRLSLRRTQRWSS